MSPARLGSTQLNEIFLAYKNGGCADMLSLLDQNMLLMLRVGEHEAFEFNQTFGEAVRTSRYCLQIEDIRFHDLRRRREIESLCLWTTLRMGLISSALKS